jgi:hypothetical protein
LGSETRRATGADREDEMFAQVIQGRARDADAIRKRMEEWDRSVKPGADGFLGSTAGVADDGEFIAIARFESEDAARRNSDRPEQGAWWSETEQHLEGGVRFYDCTEVEALRGGGSDDAGFVQVIQGRATDKERLRQTEAGAEEWLKQNRPDLIGGVRAWQGNDFSEFAYFTSEEAARTGEKRSQESETEADYGDWSRLIEDLKFIDLRSPVFSSP